MHSGRLRDKITIQSQPELTDDYGEEVETYNKVFSAKCDFKIMSATELLQAGLALSEEYVTILMRLDNRLKYDHLILHKNNRYEVASIRPTNHDKEMIVTASRQVV